MPTQFGRFWRWPRARLRSTTRNRGGGGWLRTGLHLYSDAGLQLPNTDPDGRDLMLSCGAALNHCVVALSAVGWQAKIIRLPNPAEPDHLAAIEVAPRSADHLDIMLAAAIPRRRTDRRPYSRWTVPVADIALMAARAARKWGDAAPGHAMEQLKKVVLQSVLNHSDELRLSRRAHSVERALRFGRRRSGSQHAGV